MTNAKPSVDDQHWFDESKRMIESAASSRNEAGAKLQTMVGWLWGIYTASAAIGISLSNASYPGWVIALIAAPSPMLIASYWLAVWTQMPVSVQFDPRVPKQIKLAYIKGIETKGKRLQCALGMSLLAAFFVSAGLISASLVKEDTKVGFKAFHHDTNGQNSVSIKGTFPIKGQLTFRIKQFPVPKAGPKVQVYKTLSPDSGDLLLTIPIGFKADKYIVAAEWQDSEGVTRSISRTISAQSSQTKNTRPKTPNKPSQPTR